MQPMLVLRDHKGGTNKPDAGLPFLNEYLTTCVFLPQGNLTIGTDYLDADLDFGN